jgi:gamma-glutamylcyclotransferase (GGCT)/AIG2-like uncharacterized protein YtfP
MLKIFVYGTLKPGESNYQHFCTGKVVKEQLAIAFGTLFALPIGYPAMTVGDRPVKGYLLTFNDSSILACLDRLEDYDPHRERQKNEYNRQLIETFELSHQPLATAWVYLMDAEKIHRKKGVLLPSGAWSSSGVSA